MPGSLKAVVIDDTPQAIRLLKHFINEIAPGDIQVVGEAGNAEDGLNLK